MHGILCPFLPLPDPHLAESSPSAAKLPGKIIFHPISALSALIFLSTQKDRSVICNYLQSFIDIYSHLLTQKDRRVI